MKSRQWIAAVVLVATCASAAAWQAAPSAEQCDGIASVPMRQHVTYGEIQSVFNTRCSNCHVEHGGTPQADLDLDPGVSWFYLVDQPSSMLAGAIRVVPGNPATSYLFQKVNCAVTDQGLRMPRLRQALPLAEQALIHDWILAGAPEVEDDTIFRARFETRG
ncbi:hypothetical protein [Tahibacter soli]|jgi:hypothetical protein|uniref:Cytochrome c domain-containing protein n=1 Tax=Tahibacter soli TaxID=2983605 RepID=A0A9X4BH57_9GAMM|nr:hypothetical protein [Tahibacter soli]MDC8012401.1 hypothetical protein [Tahibacter soli]